MTFAVIEARRAKTTKIGLVADESAISAKKEIAMTNTPSIEAQVEPTGDGGAIERVEGLLGDPTPHEWATAGMVVSFADLRTLLALAKSAKPPVDEL